MIRPKENELTVSERQLLEFGRCSLRVGPGLEYRESDFLYVAGETLRVILYRSFLHGGISLQEINTVIDSVWKKDIKKTINIDNSQHLIRMGRRLKELTYTYQVVGPVANYSLILNKGEITGEFGTVRSKSHQNRLESIVKLCLYRSEPIPNIIDLARVLSGSKNTLKSGVNLLQYSVLDEASSVLKVDLSKAEKYLNKALESYQARRLYPSPGSYCSNCLTKGCL